MGIIINDGFIKLNEIPKPHVKGVVRRRGSTDFKDMLLPAMLRLKWQQEEKYKNEFLYGIGLHQSPEGFSEGFLQKQEEVKPAFLLLVPPHLEKLAKEVVQTTEATNIRIVVDPSISGDKYYLLEEDKLGRIEDWSGPDATTKTNSPGPTGEPESDA